jgi:hypothetical protein
MNRKKKNFLMGDSYVNVTDENIKDKRIVYKNVMLPVWTLMTIYRGKNYIFAMNGQTGKITGKLPISKQRLILWFICIFIIVFLICFLGAMLI